MPRTSCRSISYAPDGPIPGPQFQPEWTICRNHSVFPVPDNATLERWTKEGRVRSDDYLVNHPLDVCVQAREVAELDAIFRNARAHVLGRIWRALASSSIGLLWLEPLAGTLLLMGAIGAAGLRLWTLRHRQSYRLSTCAAGSPGAGADGQARLLTVTAA